MIRRSCFALASCDDAVLEVIDKVRLKGYEKQKVSCYSLGMKQRLGIAQAIMEEPQILFLDEPLSGLDKDGLREMRQLFLEYKESGRTIIIASHNTDDIGMLCDHVYEISNGGMVKCS